MSLNYTNSKFSVFILITTFVGSAGIRKQEPSILSTCCTPHCDKRTNTMWHGIHIPFISHVTKRHDACQLTSAKQSNTGSNRGREKEKTKERKRN